MNVYIHGHSQFVRRYEYIGKRELARNASDPLLPLLNLLICIGKKQPTIVRITVAFYMYPE